MAMRKRGEPPPSPAGNARPRPPPPISAGSRSNSSSRSTVRRIRPKMEGAVVSSGRSIPFRPAQAPSPPAPLPPQSRGGGEPGWCFSRHAKRLGLSFPPSSDPKPRPQAPLKPPKTPEPQAPRTPRPPEPKTPRPRPAASNGVWPRSPPPATRGRRPMLAYPCLSAPIVVGDRMLFRADTQVLCLGLTTRP